MTPKELNTALCSKVERVLAWLFKGAGTLKSGRFSIGNIEGDDGDSLYVYLNNGAWKDSATDQKGDLLELVCIKFGSKAAGMDAAYSFLGISKPMKEKKRVTEWRKPKRDWTQLTENPEVFKYLTKERKIPESILKRYGVRAKDDEFMTFVTYTHELGPDGKPFACGSNYISIERTLDKNGKLKKTVFQQEKPLATLWGHTVVETRKNADGKSFLIITEGQIDAMSVASLGYVNVVSIPFGVSADGWIENSWEYMLGFDEIYLFFDNDKAGREACEAAAKRIGFERCRRVELPGQYNDANQALLDGYDINPCIEAAKEFKPSKLVEVSEIFDESLRRLSLGRREEQGIPFLGWEGDESIRFRTREKEMTLYTGWPGDGKSNALYQETTYLVCCHRKKLVIASLEEDAEDILGIMAFHALATQYDPTKTHVIKAFKALKELFRGHIYFYYHRNRAPFKEVLQHAEFTIRKHGAEHFIMDSVAKTDLDIEDNKDANQFVSMMTNSMNETGAHYHIVAHARKGDGKNKWAMPGLNEVKGSNQFGIETFNCLSFWRDPRKVEMLQEVREKGFYTKREWQETPDSKTGGFLNKGSRGFKDVEMSEEEVQLVPDSYVEVCKQKVGGQKGRYGTFFDPTSYRLMRSFGKPKPYAIDIYEEYIRKEEEGAF